MASSVSLSNQQATEISQYIRSTWVSGFGGISWPQFEQYLGITHGTAAQKQTIAKGIGAMALKQTGTSDSEIGKFLEVPHGATVASLIQQALIGIGAAGAFAALGGGVATDVNSPAARGVGLQEGAVKTDVTAATGAGSLSVDPSALAEKDAAGAAAGAAAGGGASAALKKLGSKLAGKAAGTAAKDATGAAAGAGVAALLVDPNLWKRIIEIVLGIALLLLGLKNLTGIDPVNIVTKTAATAAKVAK